MTVKTISKDQLLSNLASTAIALRMDGRYDEKVMPKVAAFIKNFTTDVEGPYSVAVLVYVAFLAGRKSC